MAKKDDLFERRNRLRIVALVALATLNYMIALAMAAVAVVVGLIAAALLNLDFLTFLPEDTSTWKWVGIGLAVIVVGSFVVGLVVALFKIPFARRSLERRVLQETGARIEESSEGKETRNLLEGLAIAAGVPPPRYAVIQDPAPNSFGVGTKPENTIVGVTTGLSDKLSRDELEAILAYEISRIKSMDVALSSWTVALTSGAISAVDGTDDIFKGIFGWLPRRFGEWLQLWALRDQGTERDRAAVRFTRNPKSLIRALEQLDDDATTVTRVSRATAPLWVEFPASALRGKKTRATRRLAKELLLDERIDALRGLAGMPPREIKEKAPTPETPTVPAPAAVHEGPTPDARKAQYLEGLELAKQYGNLSQADYDKALKLVEQGPTG